MSTPSDTRRPAPLAQGTLAKRPISHLLAYGLERKLTGSLVFGNPDAAVGAIVLRGGAPRKVDARGPDAWGELCVLPDSTPFAYYDGYDALAGKPDAPIGAVAAVVGVLRRRPPTEHMKQVLARVGDNEIVIIPEVGLDGLDASERAAIERFKGAAFTLPALRSDAVLAANADTILYGLLITKVAQLVPVPGGATPSQLVAEPDSSQRMVSAEPASGIPPAAPSSSEEVPDSSERAGKSTASTVGRVKLTRTTKPRLSEERAVISQFDGRASMPPVAGAAAPAPSAALAGAELARRRKEILDRAAIIDQQNYFEMLAVSIDTPTSQIQTAFLALAKRWHPDRVPPELADVRESCARVFARLSEASATLTDEEQRKRYVTLLDEGGATPEDQEKIASVLEAATAFQKAEVMLKRGDLARAREFVAMAAHLDPMPDYVALLAWIDSQSPNAQSDDAMRKFEAQLTTAIEKSDRCERAFFYRGNIRKRLNDVAGSMADFRRAFELNPKNLDAQREVRLYEMRAQKEHESKRDVQNKPPPKPSFIGRLFNNKK